MSGRLGTTALLACIPLAMILGSWNGRSNPPYRPTAASEVPIGGVLLFWGRLTELPEGFEACDGTLPITKGALLKEHKPDLRNRFAMGTLQPHTFDPRTAQSGGDHRSKAGRTGGHTLTQAQLPAHTHPIAHSHDLAAHTHSLVDHSHPIGNHTHPVAELASISTQQGSERFLKQGSTHDSGPATGTTGPAGAGTTGQGGPGASGPANPANSGPTGGGQPHEHSLPESDNRPAYLELLYIVRVK